MNQAAMLLTHVGQLVFFVFRLFLLNAVDQLSDVVEQHDVGFLTFVEGKSQYTEALLLHSRVLSFLLGRTGVE